MYFGMAYGHHYPELTFYMYLHKFLMLSIWNLYNSLNLQIILFVCH